MPTGGVKFGMTVQPSTVFDSPSSRQLLIETIQQNWALEMDGAAMYNALAERERIPERRLIFQKLSDLEKKHADQWAAHLKSLGEELPSGHSGRGHETRIADTPGGMQQVVLAIEAEERRDVAGYLRQLQAVDDEETATILRG